MNRQHILIAAVASAVALVAGAAAAHDNRSNIRNLKNYLATHLVSSQEVPLGLADSKGTFKAVIDEVNQTITYELTYEGLEAAPQQAHIHIGQRLVNGGISFFLCGNAPTVPAATVPQPPACPAAPATVTGVITPANIIGPNSQGVAPGADFARVVEALRSGDTYANVHTVRSPGGEIRGQVKIGFLHDRD